MRARGRWTATILALAGLAVVVAGAWSLRHLAVEEWWLWKLGAGDEESPGFRVAVYKLTEMHSVRAIPRLLRVLEGDRPPSPWLLAELELWVEGAGDRAANHLASFLEGLRGPHPFRIWASDRLLRLRPDSAPARATLLSILGEDGAALERSYIPPARIAHCGPREEALAVLLAAGVDPALRLGAVVRDGGDRALRLWAAGKLEDLGPAAAGAKPALRFALDDAQLPVRFAAALALARIDASQEPLLPVLDAALVSKDEAVAIRSVDLFLRLGEAARDRLPAAAAVLGRLRPETRVWSLERLGRERHGKLIEMLESLPEPPDWLEAPGGPPEGFEETGR